MEANTDPVTAWVTGPGGDRGTPAPPVRPPGRVRRKLAAAVKDGTAAAAAALYPHDPDLRDHLAAVLLESDSGSWPLVDGTALADLVPAVREWVAATGAGRDAAGDADDPLVVALSVAIIEAVRARFVRDGDEALGQIWLDFEEASGLDLAALEAVPFHRTDDEAAVPGEEDPPEADPELGEFRGAHLRRRRISPMPWALMLAGFGIVLWTARLLDTGGPGWVALAIGAAAVGFLIGWGRTTDLGDGEHRVESLEVYEHGVIVNTASGRSVTVRPARLWAAEPAEIGEQTPTLALVWTTEGRPEPVFTDLNGFTEPKALKRSLAEGEFVRDRTPAGERG